MTSRLRVHVLSQPFPSVFDLLKKKMPHVEFVKVPCPGREGVAGQNFIDILSTKVTPETVEALRDAEYAVMDAHFLGQMMYDMPKLKWVHLTWAGIEMLLRSVRKDKREGLCGGRVFLVGGASVKPSMDFMNSKMMPLPSFPVCRFSGRHFGQQMAEYCIWSIVGFDRDLFKALDFQKERSWNRTGRMDDQRFIRDMTFGIMGVGLIGSYIAKTMKFLGGRTIGLGLSEKKKEDVPFLDDYFTASKLDEFLSQCDVLVGVLPSTPATTGLLNGGKLRSCAEKKPLLINIGRGTLIAEEEILKALDSGWLRGAVLDVFVREPLPKESSLWNHPNVYITPHVSGISRPQDVVEQAVESLESFLRGEEPVGIVDWNAGY